MDSDKEKNNRDNQTVDQPPGSGDGRFQDAPVDALSRTPDDLADEQASDDQAAAKVDPAKATAVEKQPSKLKQLIRKMNLYFLLFMLLVTVAAVITVVNFLNSQKLPPEATFASQDMTEESLKQLANSDASVGTPSQTLTIQGNAVIDGATLMRGDLSVAGNLQASGDLRAAGLTISGSSNLGEAQVNSLQVATNTAIEGSTTLRDLNVSGSSSFSGAVTASQLTTSRLVLSGNASLEVPNHLSFTGPSPSRSILSGALGSGGSASVNGSDTAGTVNINTGNGPKAGCFVRINFNQNFTKQPRVIISPVGAGAGRSDYYVDRNQSGFSICTANPAPANQSFAFDYFVTG